jgi:hypothetical protein
MLMNRAIICQAEDFAGIMWCGRCNMSWPINATDDEVPHCKPKPDPPVTLAEMIAALERQVRIDIGSQIAMVKAGLRDGPDLPTLRRCTVLRRIATLLERLQAEPGLIERLREG